ncbi:MAG: MFS transporter [Litorilinea sp.]
MKSPKPDDAHTAPVISMPGISSSGNLLWLGLLSLALLLALLPFSSYAAALPFIQAEWGLGSAAAGIVFSGYLVGYAIASLFVVPLTDRYAGKWVLLGSMLVMVVGNLLFAWLAEGMWSGALLRGVAGAGHVGAYIPAVRLVSERFAAGQRGRAVGFFVGAGYAGTTLSYSFMGLLLDATASWRMAYLITAGAGVFGFVVLLLLLTGRWQGSAPAVERAPAAVALQSGAPIVRSRWPTLGRFGVIRNEAVFLNTMAYALHTAELYLARLWFPLLLGSAFTLAGLAPDAAAIQAATWSGPMFMLGMVGVFVGGYLSDRVGRTLAAAVIFLISGLCSFAAGSLLNFPTLLLGLGYLYGLTTAADSAIYSTSILEIAPAGETGAAQAVQSFVGFAIGAAVPIVAGVLLDQGTGGQWRLAFGFNGLLALGGIWAVWRLRRLPVARQMADGRR